MTFQISTKIAFAAVTISVGLQGTAIAATDFTDIYTGASSSRPREFVTSNGFTYFSANSPSYDRELVRATQSGYQFIDLRRNGSSNPSQLTSVGGTIYFTATSEQHGTELWKVDASTGRASEVLDIKPGRSSSRPSHLTSINGYLMFLADDGDYGRELWRSDGTASGTHMVADIHLGKDGITHAPLTDVDGTLFFHADDGIHGRELWSSDGTTAGTNMVKDINYGSGHSTLNTSPASALLNQTKKIYSIEGMAFFMANDGFSGQELWRSDGTAAGTMQIAEINPTYAGSLPAHLTYHNGVLLFTADDGASGRELYVTKGSLHKNKIDFNLFDIYPGVNPVNNVPYTSHASNFIGVDDFVFFTAKTDSEGFELMEYNLVTSRTRLVIDINPGSAGSDVGELTLFDGKLYFSANDGKYGKELWSSDGTARRTMRVTDLNNDAASSRPAQLHVTGSDLLFVADDGVHGRELVRFY